MRDFLVGWFINAVALFIVASLLPAVQLEDGIVTLAGVSIIIGVINALVRPILYFASCGLIVLTLGLIIPVLNALLLLLADSVAGDAFNIDGIVWAIVAALLMGFINSILHQIFDNNPSDNKSSAKDIR